MKVITITIEKGGVGKTTISTHLYFYLIMQGYKVAFLDADGQGNSTRFLNPKDDYISSINFLSIGLEQIGNNNQIFSSTRDIFGMKAFDKNILINNKKLLENNNYDYLIIDTNPALSNCSLACMLLTDIVFMPINMSKFAYESVEKTIDFISHVRQEQQTEIEIGGLIPNLVNTKSPQQIQSLAQLLDSHPGKIMPFLAHRAPYTAVMNGTTPLWETKPMAGNIKVANHEMKKLFSHMERVIG